MKNEEDEKKEQEEKKRCSPGCGRPVTSNEHKPVRQAPESFLVGGSRT
jgi:hypothetical protein